MDAELTWQVWRRILRDDRLSQQLMTGEVTAAGPGVTAEETAVLTAYAAQREGSGWAIRTFRYRSVSSALHALSAGAPLTLRLLHDRDLDLRKLAQAFTEERGWADDGPFVYHRCAAFLRYLLADEGCRALAGFADLAALELAVAGLLTQCAGLPAASWPTAASGKPPPADPQAGWYVQTGTGVIVTTAHRLTPWLTQPDLFGRSPLAEEPEHLLVYLPSPAEEYALCVLGDEAAAAFRRLASPAPYRSLTSTLAELTKLGVVRAAARDEGRPGAGQSDDGGAELLPPA